MVGAPRWALDHVLPAIGGTGDDALEGSHDVPELLGFDRADVDHPFVGDDLKLSRSVLRDSDVRGRESETPKIGGGTHGSIPGP